MNLLHPRRETRSPGREGETERLKKVERDWAAAGRFGSAAACCRLVFAIGNRARLGRLVLASLILCLVASPLFAGTITGTVRNGTTNQPAAGVSITLIRLQGGMEEAANTKTDAQGRYSLQDPSLGQAPMLLRADYKGVTYFQPATPGKTTADIQVFEHTEKQTAFSVADHAIILQPSSSGLSVGEIYDIQNNTQPPQAYFRQNGSFEFPLPQGAQVSDVSASDSSQMPVKQATIDKGKNLQAIDFPFRPGESGVRISYTLPYSDNRATLRFSSPYTVGRLAVFAPPSVKVAGDGFSPAGQNQGFSAYIRDSVAANTPVSVSISGTGTVSESDSGAGTAGADQSGGANANSRLDQGGDSSGQSASITMMPARLDSVKWVLVAGFAAIFALGFLFLWKRPQSLLGASGGYQPDGSVNPGVAATGKKARVANSSAAEGAGRAPAHNSQAAAQHPAAPLPTAASSTAVEEAQRHVSGSLDELKDKLFRLELRKQAGTISDADYARERQRIEQLLRDLVRG